MELHNESGKNILHPPDPETFYSQLAASMKYRLLESSDRAIVQACNVLIPEKWPNEVESNITFEEKKIRMFDMDCQTYESFTGINEIYRHFAIT